MQLQHEFTLPIPPDQAWEALLDVERIAPCMPGATLDRVDGDEFSGRVALKVGPLRLTYRGDARITERDPSTRRVVIAAEGTEARGSGTAAASVAAVLSEVAEGTRVDLTTDLALTGRPAQFGRGLVGDVAGTLIGQFADRLSQEMLDGAPGHAQLPAAPDDAVSAGAPAPGTTPGQRADADPATGTAAGAQASAPPGAGHGGPERNGGSRGSHATGLAGPGFDGNGTGRAAGNSEDGADSSLDVVALLRSSLGSRGLVVAGGAAAVVLAFWIGRRSRARAVRAGSNGQLGPGGWPVLVIDAGEK